MHNIIALKVDQALKRVKAKISVTDTESVICCVYVILTSFFSSRVI